MVKEPFPPCPRCEHPMLMSDRLVLLATLYLCPCCDMAVATPLPYLDRVELTLEINE